MSSQSKNQTLYIGLAVVAAAAAVAGYLVLANQKSNAKGGSSLTTKSVNNDRSKSPDRAAKRDATETTTPLVSNISGRAVPMPSPTSQSDKEVHAKIEDLDRTGKKLFKEKKVSICCIVANNGTSRINASHLSFYYSILKLPRPFQKPWT